MEQGTNKVPKFEVPELNFDGFKNALMKADPEKLFITEEVVAKQVQDIVSDIPDEVRHLLPKNDVLAALAYAPVYYNMYPFGVRKHK